MKIQTFIFVHDQNIILDYINVGKFKDLPNLKFVFVGNKSVDKVRNLDNVIICRELPINIEKYPKFTSLTGWYALWKNNLIDADYINLFEYDLIVSNEFTISLNDAIKNKPDFIGYIPRPISMFDYISNFMWVKDIMPSIKKHYDINIFDLIDNIKSKNPSEVWSCTSNSTFSISTFEEYMGWFDKLIDDLKNSDTCGHAHERSISFFYFIHNKNVVMIPDIITHFQLDSHKTQGHFVDFENSMKTLLSN
jgi:hypothetical protein